MRIPEHDVPMTAGDIDTPPQAVPGAYRNRSADQAWLGFFIFLLLPFFL